MWEFCQNRGEGAFQIPLPFLDCFLRVRLQQFLYIYTSLLPDPGCKMGWLHNPECRQGLCWQRTGRLEVSEVAERSQNIKTQIFVAIGALRSYLPEGLLLHWCQHSCLSPSSPCCYLMLQLCDLRTESTFVDNILVWILGYFLKIGN